MLQTLAIFSTSLLFLLVCLFVCFCFVALSCALVKFKFAPIGFKLDEDDPEHVIK